MGSVLIYCAVKGQRTQQERDAFIGFKYMVKYMKTRTSWDRFSLSCVISKKEGGEKKRHLQCMAVGARTVLCPGSF